MLRFVLPAVVLLSASAGEPQFELTGRFTPEGQASVSLHAVASPFAATTYSEDGRFTFKKLEPGAYTLALMIPGRGEIRQTVEIGPAAADAHGRVSVALTLKDSDFVSDSLRREHTIASSQLAVPEKAVREYEEAQKDLSRKDTPSATKRLERAVEIAPEFSAAWNNLGTIAYQTQKYARAEECFRTALAADPSAFEPLVNLGGVLVNLHKLDEAWKYNAYAVQVRPNDALANSQLAMTYFQEGDLDLAEKHFLVAVRGDPAHFSHPQLFLAEIYLRRGQRPQAALMMEDFLKQHPDWPQAAKMRETIETLRR